MKEFKNPQINIFEFSARDTIIMASQVLGGEDGSEGVGGIEGVMPTSINASSQTAQVNIDTITR